MGSTIKAWVTGDKSATGLQFLKKAGGNWRLVLLGLTGILLLILSARLDTPAPPAAPDVGGAAKTAAPSSLGYEAELENKMANLLSQIKGAGSVSVNITLENGAFSEHAKNITRENRSAEEKDSAGGIRVTAESKETQQVLFSKEGGADRPVTVREYKPVVRGVVVVAEGADDSAVKSDITRAVEAGLGVAPYKIAVLAQRKRGD